MDMKKFRLEKVIQERWSDVKQRDLEKSQLQTGQPMKKPLTAAIQGKGYKTQNQCGKFCNGHLEIDCDPKPWNL